MPSADDQSPQSSRPAAPGGGEGNGAGASEASRAQQEREEHARGSAALAWRGAKRFAYGIGGVLAAVLVLLGVGLLLLQTEWGSRAAKDLILAKINPLGEAQLQIDDLDGNWITHLEAKGVRLVRPLTPSDEVPAAPAPAPRTAPDSVRMVQIDSLNTDYRLLELLSNRVHLSGGQVYDPDVRMAQQIDGSWDLLQPFVSDTTAQDTTESAWTVRLDSVRLRGGRLDARFHTRNGADSTLRVRDLEFFAADMDVGGGRAPRIDVRALAARFTPPGQTLERHLTADGRLNERTLTLRNLGLDSPYSDVSGQGTLLLPDAEGGPVQNIDFRLNADPLSFRDLAGFVPGIDPSRSVRFRLGVTGTSERLRPTLDATFSDGGTARLSGTVQTGLGDAPLGADLDGQVRGLHPGFFTQGPPVGEVSGDVSADLSGATAERLEGTVRAALFDTRIGEYLFGRTTLDARFPGDGTVVLDAQGGLRGASFAASGTVRPFGDPLAYDLDGRFQNLDLAQFSEGRQSSDLDGQISIEGYGTSPAEANVTAQLALDGSRINQFAVNEGQFAARLIDGTLRLQARMRSPEGTADFDGRVELLADPLRYQIREGRVENLDVAALAGDTTRSSFTGTFRLEGSGTNPQGDLRLDVAGLQLTDSYYGPYVINATNLDATVAGGRVALAGQADLEGGSFDLSDAVIYPFQEAPSFSVGSASFANVNIGRLGQYPGGDVEQSSNLNGNVTLEGQGFDPQTMYLTGTARLDSSRLNRQTIQSAAAEMTLQDGRLAYDGTLEVPEGQTRIAGTVRPFAEDPTFAVSTGTFSGIDVGALAGIEGLDTNLQGEILSLEGTGFSLEDLRGNARIDLSGSRINDVTISGGTLDLDAGEGGTDVVADLRFAGGGRVDLQARLDRAGEGLSYRAEGTIDSLDAGGLVGDRTRAGPLSLTLDVRGEGTDPRTATSQGRIRLTSAHVAGIQAQRLLLDYNLNEGLLVVDTLALRSNVADATGGGTLALYDPEPQQYASRFRFTARVDTLAPVRPLVGDSLGALAVGENHFQGRLTSRPGGPFRLESDVSVTELVYGDTRVSRFDGAVRAATAPPRDSTGAGGLLAVARALSARGVAALQNAQVRGETGYLARGPTSVRAADGSAIYGGDEINLQLRAKVDEERDIELAGVLDPRPEARRVRLDTLNVRFGADRWKLLQDATITYGEEYRVSGLLLFTEDGQQIAADGVVDFDGRQSLVVTIEAFRIDAVADLVGYDGLGGTLGGTLTLSGPAQRPELEGTLDADLTAQGERTGDARVALDYAGRRLGVDATLENDDRSALTAEGYLPLDLRLVTSEDPADVSIPDSVAAQTDTVAIGEEGSPVDIAEIDASALGLEELAFTVEADSFAVGWVRPFLDREQVEDIGGRLAANIDVGGTLGAPELQGTAALTSGTFELASIGTAYRDMRAQLRFTDDQVQVQRAVLESGDGRLTASGTMALQELTLGQLDLAVEADQFRVVDTDEYGATASGDVQLQGTTEAPVLRGNLAVRDADLYLDALRGGGGDYAQVNLAEDDLRALRENFGMRVTERDTAQSQVYQALAMNLDMEIERDTWLRSTANPELDVQLEGNLNLEKQAQQDFQLFGSIEVVPERSRVVQFGRRFEIASGVITFNGNPANPSIDLEAEYNVGARQSRGNEATITLSVRGRPGDLTFDLGSSPSMSTTDIVSYIATGRPAGAGGGAGSSDTADQLATGAALGQLANFFEGLASEQGIGLDVIEVRADPQRGTLLTAGEYLYPGALPNPVFVAVGQPISSGSNDVGDEENETEITFEYEVTEGFLVRLLRRESIRLNLRYEYAY